MDSSIFGLAKCFLSMESMTNKKLQKLCYYAQAWNLALNDERLLDAEFEAWVHGPVNPELYQKYRDNGFQKIPKYSGDLDVPEDFMGMAKKVFYTYGDLDGNQLEDLTHREDPWIKARGTAKPWEASQDTISEDDMKTYYRSIMAS